MIEYSRSGKAGTGMCCLSVVVCLACAYAQLCNGVCLGPAYTSTTTVKMTTATISTTISTTSIHVSGELDPSVGTGSASIVTVLKHRRKELRNKHHSWSHTYIYMWVDVCVFVVFSG